jgi:hypothetical protein
MTRNAPLRCPSDSAMTIEQRIEAASGWFLRRGRAPYGFQDEVWRAYWRSDSGLLNAATGTLRTTCCSSNPGTKYWKRSGTTPNCASCG